MVQLYFPFTLRIYGHVLNCLSDHNFTGMQLFYRIKDCCKCRDIPYDLLLKPLQQGLAFKIGEWSFDTMFDPDNEHDGTDKPYFARLVAEDLLWFLEDVGKAAEQSQCFGQAGSLDALNRHVRAIVSDTDEESYWRHLERTGRRTLIKEFKMFCAEQREPLSRMKVIYAYAVADRILHDRQLCHFISQTVMDIGFDGETIDGLRSQWVYRKNWPARVKEILVARDRGKCAQCGTDITQELHGDQHIDHMIPIVQGGCNDLVNLQLLCASCNRKKAARSLNVKNSVPPYIRRK